MVSRARRLPAGSGPVPWAETGSVRGPGPRVPDQAGFSPGSPASETKEAAVRTGAPGVVTADTVR